MKKIGLVLTFSSLLLLVTACAQNPLNNAPEPTNESQVMASGFKAPLIPFTSSLILDLCPNVEAQYLSQVEEDYSTDELTGYVCRTDATTSAEEAFKVNNLNELLEAYRAPNDYIRPEQACIALAADPLIVWVHTGDQIISFAAPVNSCGFPQDYAAETYNNLDLTLVPMNR